MEKPDRYSFRRYLQAKKSVDDRCLNHAVLERLREMLPGQREDYPLRVLEIGAGIGTMFERLADWGLLTHVHYTAIDLDPQNIRSTQQYLLAWGARQKRQAIQEDHKLIFKYDENRLILELQTIGLDDFLKKSLPAQVRWDLLIAHAFMDLIDIPNTLPDLLSLVVQGGFYYFTINFDGVTIIEPLINPVLDEQIISLYHRSMNERSLYGQFYGDSQTGRHLFRHLQGPLSEILAAGTSDWVVHPISGSYPDDESYFLDYIIHTINQRLENHPELDKEEFASWIGRRHEQVKRGELVFIAHQLDLLGKRR